MWVDAKENYGILFSNIDVTILKRKRALRVIEVQIG